MLDSRAVPSTLSTVERGDPYWDSNWVPGSQAVWSSRSSAEKSGESMTKVEALSALFGRRRRTALSLIASLDAWSTLTAEQAALVAGDRALLDPSSLVPRALHSLGILDVGRYPQALARRDAKPPTWLYRRAPCNGLADLTTELTWAERVATSGGFPWSTGTSFDRHNILATELALRAAEYLPVSSVLGEKFTHANLLASTSGVASKYTHRADALLVRQDGLRIAIEMTATRSATFDAKVERWAKLLHEQPMDTTGLIVLFVAVPHPGERGSAAATDIRRAVQKVMRKYPERSRSSPASRIGVVGWSDWFPGRHLISDAFLSMEAKFPVGRDSADRWRAVPIADISFDPADRCDPLALARNASALYHVPHWLRTVDPNEILGTPLSRSGHRLPVLPALRPDILDARPYKGGERKRGAVGRPPRRLILD